MRALSWFFVSFTFLLWSCIVVLYLTEEKESVFVERLSWSDKEGRDIIIGSVSGCIKELQQLIKSSSFVDGKDRLVFVGDMVGSGPGSTRVVQFAMDHEALCVRGPMEDRLVSWYISTQNKPTLTLPEEKIAEELTEDQWSYLMDCGLSISLPMHNAVIVHYGINPNKDREKQSESILLQLGQKQGSIPNQIPLWFPEWKGPETIIVSNSEQDTTLKYEKKELIVANLHSSVEQGRWLSALALPDMKIIQTPAKKIYKE